MGNVNLAHTEELVAFDCPFVVNFVRKLPLLVDFTLSHVEDVPHSLVATHYGLIFLNQAFDSFQHQRVQIRGLDELKQRMIAQEISRRQLLSCKVIIFYLPDVAFNGDPHLEVEQLIYSPLFVILLQQLQLVIQQSNRYLIGLDLLHYLREAVLDLRVQISLC